MKSVSEPKFSSDPAHHVRYGADVTAGYEGS